MSFATKALRHKAFFTKLKNFVPLQLCHFEPKKN